MKREEFKEGVLFRVKGEDQVFKMEPIIPGSRNLLICDANDNEIVDVYKITDEEVFVETTLMSQHVTFKLPFSELELVTTNP